MKMKLVETPTFFQVLVLVSQCPFPTGRAENILFFWLVSGTSHRIAVWPLVETLVEKGHNVTFLSPRPPTSPNSAVHEIVVSGALGRLVSRLNFIETRVQGGPEAVSKIWSHYFDLAIVSCEHISKDKEMTDWINTSKYDLIIINAMFNDCAYGLVHKWKAPFIIYGPTHTFGWWSESYGYPDENYPEFMHHFPENMTFFQSVQNALMPFFWQLNREYYMFPKVEKSLREGLGLHDMPPLVDIEKNVSLVFMNTHFTEEYPRSLPPLFVQVGGMHCTDKTKTLPTDLEEFVGKSGKGFAYFSFGTFVEVHSLPIEIVNSLLYAMGNTTQLNFLVRWFEDDRVAVPPNVMLLKTWVPQQDILAHPKIRLFISHGGLMGTQEALFHAVPTIVIPLFADQDYNAGRIESRGRGLALDIRDMRSPETLQNAIKDILNNGSYAEATREWSKLFRTRPQSPLETAVWWVEDVMRHKTGKHLHPIGMSRTWYERRMLHIWAFLLFSLLFGVSIILLVIVKCSKMLFSKGNKTSKKKKD